MASHDLVVVPQSRPLSGSVPTPADDGIGQLALFFAALADGTSEIRGLSKGPDMAATIDALRTLGVTIEDGPKGVVRLRGVSLFGLSAPTGLVHCAGSASTMRILSGILVAHPFRTVLTGDEALIRMSMARTTNPLRRRGAQIEGVFSKTEVGEVTPPLEVGPMPQRLRLSGLEHELSSASPHVKEALLFSGLYADGPTLVRERVVSRDHAERMLQALDVPLTTAGPMACLDPEGWSAKISAFSQDIPGDFSTALLLLSAATIVPQSHVCARAAGLNPTRTGGLDCLRQMGGSVEVQIQKSSLGEPEGIACASYAPLRAAPMAGEVLARARGDLPMLAVLAARAHGQTEMEGVPALFEAGVGAALIDSIASLLRRFGVNAETTESGLAIDGRPTGPLRAADIDCQGDAWMAAAAMLLGLVGDGPTRVRRVDSLALRFPRIVGMLRALGAELHVEEKTE
jgi:3-phosphoshikimate 1-carboxyvinyltransferase